jgi:hypothetical protein
MNQTSSPLALLHGLVHHKRGPAPRRAGLVDEHQPLDEADLGACPGHRVAENQSFAKAPGAGLGRKTSWYEENPYKKFSLDFGRGLLDPILVHPPPQGWGGCTGR